MTSDVVAGWVGLFDVADKSLVAPRAKQEMKNPVTLPTPLILHMLTWNVLS